MDRVFLEGPVLPDLLSGLQGLQDHAVRSHLADRGGLVLPDSLSAPLGPDRPEDRWDLDNPVGREAPAVPACLRPGPLDPVVPEGLLVPEVLEILQVLSGLAVPADLDFHYHRRKDQADLLAPEVPSAREVPELPEVLVYRRDPVIREAHSGRAVLASPVVLADRVDLQVLADRWCLVRESSGAGRGSRVKPV